MALEPYDPCPCGNGKKFKFCCQPIIEELKAVERLIAEKQPKQALLAAEKLEPEHSMNPLLLRNKIMALLMLERHEEAHTLILQCQQANPQDPYGYYFDIRWHLYFSSWESTRPLVEGHLSFIGEKNPGLAYQLAIEIVDDLLNNGYFMAVWRYLFDALLWARNEEDARYVMSAFHELNKSNDIPLPFRNLYQLRALPENQPNQAEFVEAMQLASTRNWNKSAQLFEALSEKDPHQPVLSFNAGLCYAWSGDLAAAAELLGRAGDDLPDFEAAVELETLAQLHDQQLPEEQVPLRTYRYRVQTVSRLLSQLDQEPRLHRQPLPPSRPDTDRPPAAIYVLLDRPRDSGTPDELDSLPLTIGTVMILDEVRDPSAPGELYLRSLSPTFSDAEHELLVRAAGEQIDVTPAEGWGLLKSDDGLPGDIASLNFNVVPPKGLRRSEILKLISAYAKHVVYDQWTQLPLASLDGLTPAAAARDPELHLPVCAAINVLASVTETANYALDVDDLRQRLALPAVQPLVCNSVEELKKSSIQDCLRLSFTEVPPEVLREAFPMLASTRAIHPLRRLLTAIYDREVTIPEFDVAAVCRMACSLAIRVLDLDAAQMWCDRGRAASQRVGADLMARADWDLNDLEVAALANNEEKVVEILRKCAREYFLKLPQLKPQIQQLLTLEKLDSPRIQGIMNGTDLQTVGAGIGDGGLWTPESAAASASGGKLWVPGQD
ncbi:MAG: hypothetical protein V4719_24425 [Planctomycetota bacterium]